MSTLSLGGARVLVVEDNDDNRDLVELVLSEAGAEVRAARDAKDALHLLLMWRPSVIVSDLTLPGTDGLALLREIRSAHQIHVPAICVTGRAEGDVRGDAIAAGFQGCLSKPFDPNDLVTLVRLWARRPIRRFASE
jgi:CheY-like chemotaxis protein